MCVSYLFRQYFKYQKKSYICKTKYNTYEKNTTECISPDASNSIQFTINDKGQLFYSVSKSGKLLIEKSKLGFKLKRLSLDSNFVCTSVSNKVEDTTWKPVWGEKASFRNNYKEIKLNLKQKNTGILLNVFARCYNEGVAIRYEFPKQENKLGRLCCSYYPM